MSESRKVNYNNYFHMQNRESGKVGVCKLCHGVNKVVKMKNCNTTGLRKHLQIHHKKLYFELFGSSPSQSTTPTQRTIEDCTGEDNKPREKNFERMTVAWVAYKNLPLDFFDDSFSQYFFTKLSSRKFPRTDELRDMVLRQFEFMSENLNVILNENDSQFSLTVKASTTKNPKNSCYEVSVHYIDSEWVRKSITFDLITLERKHSGEEIAGLLYKSLTDSKILKKIQAIVLDNNSAEANFAKELEKLMSADGLDFNAENQTARCLAHVLSLAVKEGLKIFNIEIDENSYPVLPDEQDDDEIDYDNGDVVVKSEAGIEQTVAQTIQKITSLVKKIRSSQTMADELKTCCDAVTVPYVRPSRDIKNSWTSMYKILKTCVDLKEPLDMLCKNPELEKYQVNESQWNMVHIILEFLNYFNQVSNIIAKESKLLIPTAVVAYYMLLEKIDSSITKLFEKEDKNALDKDLFSAFQAARDQLLKHNFKCNWKYHVSLILDPRFKVEAFDLTQWGRDLKEHTVKKFRSVYKSEYWDVHHAEIETRESNEIKMETDDSDPLGLHAYYNWQPEVHSTWESEIDIYLKMRRQPASMDMLDWWKMNSSTFPILSKMARDILAITPLSAPPECISSSEYSMSLAEYRGSLKDESNRALFFINRWMHSDSRDSVCQPGL